MSRFQPGGVEGKWPTADGAMGKARWGRDPVGKNPTDRGKNEVKRSLVVEADGGPLGVVIAGANGHDAKLLKRTLQAIVAPRPKPTSLEKRHLCLDKGYDHPTARAAAQYRGYTPPIRRFGEEKMDDRARKRNSPGDGSSSEPWVG